MAAQLKGKKIAFLLAQEGVEEVELTEPWKTAVCLGVVWIGQLTCAS